ncbi:MAG TPA: 4Fe-4S dicluster domain-containing protein [Syntrophobacteraceae bacterium]|nr:4Fe-4S dicluster domain-containing protein [Syntrophobacteraceae bacterium]
MKLSLAFFSSKPLNAGLSPALLGWAFPGTSAWKAERRTATDFDSGGFTSFIHYQETGLCMDTINLSHQFDKEFILAVEKESEQQINQCYQCGNCTAGCPYSFVYDVPVSRIMRLVQTGQKEAALSSRSIWLCATCESCTTRCPNQIDVARVMDVLRHMAGRKGIATVSRVKKFRDSFLQSLEAHGRVFELGLMSGYIAKTGRVLTDMDLGPRILPKGKLSLRPHKIKGRAEIAGIFKRFHEEVSS